MAADGIWRGTNPFRQRTWRALADREETDRWVTLHAAIIPGASGSPSWVVAAI